MRVLLLLLAALALDVHGQTVETCCRLEIKVETATGLPVPGASVRVVSGAIRYDLTTGPDGRAQLKLRAPGHYTLTAIDSQSRQAQNTFEVDRDQVLPIIMILEAVSPRRDQVTVEATVSPLEQDAPPTSATGSQLASLPQRVADVRNALPLMPGVVRTPEGKLRISGSPEYRSTFLVNSIDVTNAATGSFGPTVPIDIIDQLQIYKSPFLAEYGRFSAAVVAVTTRRGSDRWHYELNDPTPELRIRSGHIVGIRGFTPRFAATGPLVRQKLYFAGAVAFGLRKRPVYPLPFPYNEETTQSTNAFVQLDYLRSASHTVNVQLHGVPQRANFVGLNFYTPQPAAPLWRAHEFRASVQDSVQLGNSLLQSSLSVSENLSVTGGQGNADLQLTPVETFGNYPFRSDSRTRRAQWTELLALPALRAAGKHQLKLGSMLGFTQLRGFIGSDSNIQVRDLAGNRVDFIALKEGPGFRLRDTDLGLFVQDGWEPWPSLRLDVGLRSDWQSISGVTRLAPRVGLAWMPLAEVRTVLRGGFGWFFDRVPVLAYAWPFYPQRSGLPNRLLAGDGGMLTFGSAQPGSYAPRSRTWTLALDQPVGRALLLSTSYQDSLSRGLLIVEPRPTEVALAGRGSARTQIFEVISKLSWYSEQQWIMSYAATRARGDLNLFLDVAGTFPSPILRSNVYSGQPEVVRHRFLTWGVFPLGHGVRLAPVLEWRSGFPYSALNVQQLYAETPNSRRLPTFFSLDASIAKDIAMRGHKVRISFSMFNITDHGNFDAVRWNVSDPQFGEVLGRRPRRFRLNFDWLF